MLKATQIIGNGLDEDLGLSKLRAHTPNLGSVTRLGTTLNKTGREEQAAHSLFFLGKDLSFSGISVHVVYLGDQQNMHTHTHAHTHTHST